MKTCDRIALWSVRIFHLFPVYFTFMVLKLITGIENWQFKQLDGQLRCPRKTKSRRKLSLSLTLNTKVLRRSQQRKPVLRRRINLLTRRRKTRKRINRWIFFLHLGPIKKPRIYVTVNDIKGLYGVSDAFLYNLTKHIYVLQFILDNFFMFWVFLYLFLGNCYSSRREGHRNESRTQGMRYQIRLQ